MGAMFAREDQVVVSCHRIRTDTATHIGSCTAEAWHFTATSEPWDGITITEAFMTNHAGVNRAHAMKTREGCGISVFLQEGRPWSWTGTAWIKGESRSGAFAKRA